MKLRILSFIAVLCLAFGTAFSLSSCDVVMSSGISDARINEDGELVITFHDGREQNLGTVVGKDGVDGTDGADGKDGIDGKDGLDGEDGKDGILSESSVSGNLAIASAKGLRSAVSIVCKFTRTVKTSGFRPTTRVEEYSSAGSGVIYELIASEGDAFIITNYHVVYDADSDTEDGISDDISVYLYGSEYEDYAIEATYVGGSLYYDIAVLRIEDSEALKDSDVVAVTLKNSDTVSVGEDAIAIGNPCSDGISATYGYISVDSEEISMLGADNATSVTFRVMRIDTPINSGNSGGGLYNKNGELIGIVNAKMIDDGVENIAYAIPSNIAAAVADNVIDNCFDKENARVMRPSLGITVSATESKAVYDSKTGLVHIVEQIAVFELSQGSICNGLIEIGDIFVSATIGDTTTEITRSYQIPDLLLTLREGDAISFVILRAGVEISVTVTITDACISAY